jgi:hypothetical protein
MVVLDKKDRAHELVSRMVGRIPLRRWFLDGKLIVVDDRYGWIHPNPYGNPKPIYDEALRDNIDQVVFGEVIPTGTDKEED